MRDGINWASIALACVVGLLVYAIVVALEPDRTPAVPTYPSYPPVVVVEYAP